LTKSIGAMQKDLQDEARDAVAKHIGPCEGISHDSCSLFAASSLTIEPAWTPIPVFSKVLHIIALMSGRVFVGLPLSRNEEWVSDCDACSL
jgi:hypothetical protein